MEIFKFVKEYILKVKLQFLGYLTLTFVLWGIAIYLPILNGQFIDLLTTKNFKQAITDLLIIIAILNFIKIIFSYAVNIVITQISSKVTFQIIQKTVNHLKKVPISFFTNMNSGYLSQRINMDSSSVSNFTIVSIKDLSINFLTILISSLILLYINFKIAIVLLVLIPIYIFLYSVFKKKIYNLSLKYKESESVYFDEINYQIDNMKFIKTNSLFSKYTFDLENKFIKLFNSLFSLTKLNSLYTNLGQTIIIASNIIVLFLGVNEIINNNLTVGGFVVVNTYFKTIIASVEYFISFLSNYQNAAVSYNRLKELLNVVEETNGSIKLDEINQIKIDNVSLSHSQNKVFDSLSYEFNKGTVYKITGRNGAGKSTLLNLVIGLYNGCYSGNVLFNNVDLNDLDLYETRKSVVGVVDQDLTIINDSILNNINLNKEDISEDELEKLISNLNLSEFINRYEEGLYYNLNRRSYNISGGEKQKLNIARALLKNPDLLILDEANSALDVQTASKLKEIINDIKSEKIIMIVSHNDFFDEIVDCEVSL